MLILTAIALVGLWLYVQLWRKPTIYLANIAEGTHDRGIISKKTDAALALRHLCVKRGTDDDHIAVSGAGDEALGVCQDEADAAERVVAVQLLGCAARTVKVVSDGSGVLAVGDNVTTAASGKVAKVAVTVGQKYIVGKVVQGCPATDGEIAVIVPLGVWTNTAVS